MLELGLCGHQKAPPATFAPLIGGRHGAPSILTPSDRDVHQPLPPAAQRAALAALAEGLFQPASLQLDPALLRRLAPDPVDSWHAGAAGLEPQLPLLGRILQLQSAVLDQLFSDRISIPADGSRAASMPAAGRFTPGRAVYAPARGHLARTQARRNHLADPA
ncbi:MAG: zinc-dependent metalloprotease [Uliginosibacterium sp.]|nr:zinc-dependent metalloprotease [Uliginosibacterium sp.]